MADDGAHNPGAPAPHLRDLIQARLTRRAVLGAAAAAPLLSLIDTAAEAALPVGAPPTFASVAATKADTVTVPDGYEVRTLIGWGDALFDGMAPFNPDTLTRAEQEKRFGQNNDMLALFPAQYAFPWPRNQKRHLLCSNHEYVEPALMFPSVAAPDAFTAEQGAAMYAAMGLGVVQVEMTDDGAWRIVREATPGSGLNRRVTPFTPVRIEGPAANHPWIAAAAAHMNAAEPGTPAGEIACGTFANCAGGVTPWGTYLSAEENINYYFSNSNPQSDVLKAALADGAYEKDAKSYGYSAKAPRTVPAAPAQYDLAKNPTGPALYAWTIELDPYDPTWTPRKRTALGRRKAECATTALTKDGRVAVYSGDDEANEFVYKFVTRRRFNPAYRTANRDLLNEGVLHVARLEEDGTGAWIPVTLTAANRAARAKGYAPLFRDNGDLMIRAREAARLLGATPMDRPEDVEAVLDDNWRGLGPVLVVCTKNTTDEPARPGNPRRVDPERPDANPGNATGHILRIDEANNDCGARRFKWDVFAIGGDPASETGVVQGQGGTRYLVSTKLGDRETTSGARFACPDNICFDTSLNVWITTDGNDQVFADSNDCVLVTPLASTGPRPMKRFLVGPVGSEICGPMLSPDETAFFCAIQHPGDADTDGVGIRTLRWRRGEKPPSTFPDGGWPRSAVVYVTKKDGGKVGS
ncbi:MAG: DUF839 domain-containing protein [Hyphomonadaceae bacterium]|nr:DUF839 domain-containing protein [Hyphomonadaceae bacterium]